VGDALMGLFGSRGKAAPFTPAPTESEYRGFTITHGEDGRSYIHSQEIDPHGSGSSSLEKAQALIDAFWPLKEARGG
jgi:hypothetical protein